jgi:hypothetical protein
MSEQTAEATATGTEESTQQSTEQAKPTETVDFWKNKSREQEKRAKENAAAARELAEIKESQKTESEKAADRIAKAEAEVASVPAKVSDALREHLVTLHEIDKDDAELFLTANEPELLLKQVTRLLARSDEQAAVRKKNGNRVPREGNNPNPGDDPMRDVVRGLFSGD